MKGKIFQALKAKIVDPKTGKTSISDKTLNTSVDIIAKQITDESQIADAIIPYVAFLQDVQANVNSVAAAAATAKEAEFKAAKEKKEADEAAKKAAEEAAKNKDIPEWQKAIEGLTKTVETLTGTVSAFNAEKTHQTLSQKLSEKIKDVPEWYRNPIVTGRTFKDESEVDAFAQSVIDGWGTAKQDLANQGFKETVPPKRLILMSK